MKDARGNMSTEQRQWPLSLKKKKIKLLSRHTENSFHPLISPPRSPLDRRQPSSSSSNEEISRNNVTGNVGENRSVRSCFLFFFVQYLACICIDYNRAKGMGGTATSSNLNFKLGRVDRFNF